jgi:hypothetical protein
MKNVIVVQNVNTIVQPIQDGQPFVQYYNPKPSQSLSSNITFYPFDNLQVFFTPATETYYLHSETEKEQQEEIERIKKEDPEATYTVDSPWNSSEKTLTKTKELHYAFTKEAMKSLPFIEYMQNELESLRWDNLSLRDDVLRWKGVVEEYRDYSRMVEHDERTMQTKLKEIKNLSLWKRIFSWRKYA